MRNKMILEAWSVFILRMFVADGNERRSEEFK
jgi:hypothetical protein